ncbi:MAG: hypothetical protein AVDCRST_MAG16-2638 [uncultured Frankineae bacterium]|uniref:Uncharacterized protein n=1 Tax=uncultured Frankineae bacterium TaxID=437475 RepID=A0A6J4ME63_9ACTN|nr:MAG: hypothetical protein AVDCRST_MAG16-2638 [uncultured Frankineae bacterium]
MPIRTAAATRPLIPGPTTSTSTSTAGADPALDEALERISDLAARLWAVRSAHRPVAVGWRRSQTRCAGCGQPVPCATLLAAG